MWKKVLFIGIVPQLFLLILSDTLFNGNKSKKKIKNYILKTIFFFFFCTTKRNLKKFYETRGIECE